MRAECSVSLSLHWDPRKPVEPEDVPMVKAFLAAVKGMMRLPSSGLRVVGPLSTLEAAFEARLPEPEPTLEEREREAVRAALKACGGNRRTAARRLGVSRVTVARMIARYGLSDEFPTTAGRKRALVALVG